ncbi:hypothetical protein A3A55_03710 [Candidatus Roizmanbacteria bacterium RIFCSPLOWO2_01_FULL_40_14]|uniref:Uncharacterized protein n=1 Tax=Candidatus Roizmanbacteria bacterium GW2011_GWC2_41_7 TaxID=1618487 RepID=A0A0G0X703_9BACT|nr:MAG: hypothetical protein UU78_C0054G0005 [Candidatus Roizmanbacteria bacterium GW2011_GWC2_41_7]OGK50041.1 MAG: hypothetical protein A3A55_03710 [Candidatus Roizmanbacteria bacterium RIFCSPLOWO2_01_FULL_40_14]
MNELFPNSFLNDSISLIIKIMIITSLVVYGIFAFILISQIRIKRQTVTTQLGGFLELLAYIHFVLSIILIILAFIIL